MFVYFQFLVVSIAAVYIRGSFFQLLCANNLVKLGHIIDAVT